MWGYNIYYSVHVIFLALLPNHAIFALSGSSLGPKGGRQEFLHCSDGEASSKISRAYLVATPIHEFQTIARTSTCKYGMALVVGASAPISYAYEVQQKPYFIP